MSKMFGVLISGLQLISMVLAVAIDVDSHDSICKALYYIQEGEWNYYDGFRKGGTIGMVVSPYYWWNAGEMFGGLVDYYTFCDSSNSTLEGWILDAMYHQAGAQFDYVPANQSLVEGNDDQGIWGLAVMQAVERNFTNPEGHSWLELTQAVYNTMWARWDTDHCGGGLRWQIFTWNGGYNYKNTISNGCLFHIAARLARYTKLDNYSNTAETVWNWMESVEFITEKNGQMYIQDGATIDDNCTDFTKTEWSYSYGILMAGCAYMYDYTKDDKWLTRVQEILTSSSFFFYDGKILSESSCAPDHCNNDQRSFRSLFARCMGLTSVLVPETNVTISNYMRSSAIAAAQSCLGGSDGVTCGENWYKQGWDGVYGLGEQMSALETIQSLLVPQFVVYNTDNGGSGVSNPDAGLNNRVPTNQNALDITGKDKAGAGIITAVALAIIAGGAVWMVI